MVDTNGPPVASLGAGVSAAGMSTESTVGCRYTVRFMCGWGGSCKMFGCKNAKSHETQMMLKLKLKHPCLKKNIILNNQKKWKKQKKQNTSFIQLATDSCYTFQPSDGSWCQGTASSITLWLSFTSFTAGTASEAAGATEVKRSTCKRRSLVLWIIFRVSLVWFII